VKGFWAMNEKKGLDFKRKEVINLNDGKRLGYVQDVNADFKTGTITELIVPGNSKFFNIFSNGNDIIIPWNAIKVIGEDIIVVDI